MMNIGFWNIAKRTDTTLLPLIKGLVIENALDLLVLIESSFDEIEVVTKLNEDKTDYFISPSIVESRFQVYTKLSDQYSSPIRDKRRLTAREIIDPSGINEPFNLVILHFQSKSVWDESNQDAHSFEIKRFIDDLEEDRKHDRTVVIGDFNMNPFQKGMIQTTGLHAIMDKEIASEGSRTVDGERYKYFYNPMWSFFGEEGKGEVSGTFFYRSSQPICYFWNILDQVLVRPSMLSRFDETNLRIVTSINSTTLLNGRGKISPAYSDHLPIVFRLN